MGKKMNPGSKLARDIGAGVFKELVGIATYGADEAGRSVGIEGKGSRNRRRKAERLKRRR